MAALRGLQPGQRQQPAGGQSRHYPTYRTGLDLEVLSKVVDWYLKKDGISNRQAELCQLDNLIQQRRIIMQ
jgi:hypothetical protein